MFFFSSLTPYRGEIKTLRFDYNPLKSGRLGIHKDLDGNEWDVTGLQTVDGNPHIIARPLWQAKEAGAYSTATNDYNRGGRWIPYRVEIVQAVKNNEALET